MSSLGSVSTLFGGRENASMVITESASRSRSRLVSATMVRVTRPLNWNSLTGSQLTTSGSPSVASETTLRISGSWPIPAWVISENENWTQIPG